MVIGSEVIKEVSSFNYHGSNILHIKTLMLKGIGIKHQYMTCVG
jgi:hypothetical protein